MTDNLSDIPNPQKKVDNEWKEQIDRERNAPSAEKSPEKSSESKTPPENKPKKAASGKPDPHFVNFVSSLAFQALAALGEVPDPVSQERKVNPEQAKQMIDILTMIREKTEGNLTEDETNMLGQALYELQMKYVEKTESGEEKQ